MVIFVWLLEPKSTKVEVMLGWKPVEACLQMKGIQNPVQQQTPRQTSNWLYLAYVIATFQFLKGP